MPNTNLEALTQAQLKALLDSVPVPVFVKNIQGKVVLVNKAWEAAMGVALSDLNSVSGGFFTPDQMAVFHARDHQAFAAHQPINFQETYRSAHSAGNRLGQTSIQPLYDDTGQPLFLVGTTLDITEQQQLARQSECERQLLELLTRNTPLQVVMDVYARGYEDIFEGVKCSILLLDASGEHLLHSTAPSLPEAYCLAIDGAPIGPLAGSCGTAVFTGQDTLVADIATDPRWVDYKDLALAHGLRACWSIPIFSTKGKVLGSFANYYGTPRSPQPNELQAIQRGAYLIGMAIEHTRDEQQSLVDRASVQEAATHVQTILDNMADGVITINERGVVESFNKAASSIFGFDPAEVLGKNLSMLMPEPQRTQHDDYLQRFEDTGVARVVGFNREVNGKRKNGEVFPISLSVSRVFRAGRPTFIGLVRDITQRRHDEEEIRRLAFYDPLTSLPNRRLLLDRVKQALATSERNGQHGALMFLDLDHFKQLNDMLGHHVGDELLKQVAVRLRQCVREGDSVARLGGDEFVVLLESLSAQTQEAAAQAEGIASKIMASLGRPYMLHGHHYSSTPSIGIVIFLEDRHETMDELLKKADVAMYQAKAAGRNALRFYDPVMQAAAEVRSKVEREIRGALERNEFVLYYQIQVNAAGVTEGAEALIRWRHPERGMVLPSDFIALAEETGLILPMGQWVLKTACEQLTAWAMQPDKAHWKVAVNVSALQFAQTDFVEQLFSVLDITGANPLRLKLELTESILAHDVEDLIVKMTAIKARGVDFSLDDFGTGYSSLSYLKRLPIDQLKIDQSFVRDLHTDANDAAIARTVVALGHSLGLHVIAEGVETAQQHDLLLSFGCDAFQGYYFGHPVPIGMP